MSINQMEVFRESAFDNIIKSINFDRLFPQFVFNGTWSHFLFFESDKIFSKKFPEIIYEFLRIQDAHEVCLLNISETNIFEYEKIAAIFLNHTSTGSNYFQTLSGKKSDLGWIHLVDNFACASDIGDWCIYCEKGNDIAVIGLRYLDGLKKFESALKHLWAKEITEMLNDKNSAVVPFNILTREWSKGLIENYGCSAHPKH